MCIGQLVQTEKEYKPMTQDILITPGSGEPQILFRGSGVNDTPIELNVLSSYQSASGSGTALVFEGEEGQLFAITDNLSSGTIFKVGDITGLSLLSIDASGDVKIGEFGRYVGIGQGDPQYGLDSFSAANFREPVVFRSGVAFSGLDDLASVLSSDTILVEQSGVVYKATIQNSIVRTKKKDEFKVFISMRTYS